MRPVHVARRAPRTLSAGRSAGRDAVRGYEIHMGRTELGARRRAAAAAARRRRGASTSTAPSPGAVCGTYLHGLFDHPELRAAFLNGLRAARGLPLRPACPPQADDLDRLADHVEAHLDTVALDAIIWA